MKVKILACAGAGGTGKTSAINEIKKRYAVIHKPSVVRNFYKSRHIENEREFFERLSNSDKYTFQVDLMEYYVQDLHKTATEVQDQGDYDMIVTDRSIYDHVAYFLVYCMEHLTQDDYETAVNHLITEFINLDTYVAYFPFPPSWNYSDGEDGFRFLSYGKDLVVSALIGKLVQGHNLAKTIYIPKLSTPKDRAEMMIGRRFQVAKYDTPTSVVTDLNAV